MPPEPPTGRVFLVGAGPGEVDLMTVRAMRLVQSAQALLYDALVGPEILALAPAACLKIQTGKRAGRAASMKQETIHRLMLRLARRGLDVVRLKGGDPSVFGRVGEERAFLHGHGVEVEIVPGVTAASAAAAQFGFPLTHRKEARRLLVSTAALADHEAVDWASAVDPQTTLALYMGRDRAAAFAAELIRSGRAPGTPAIAVENAGRCDARAIFAPLAGIGAAVEREKPEGPVVVLIGEVTAQADAAGIGNRWPQARASAG